MLPNVTNAVEFGLRFKCNTLYKYWHSHYSTKIITVEYAISRPDKTDRSLQVIAVVTFFYSNTLYHFLILLRLLRIFVKLPILSASVYLAAALYSSDHGQYQHTNPVILALLLTAWFMQRFSKVTGQNKSCARMLAPLLHVCTAQTMRVTEKCYFGR
jgi:hypothetical protein